MLRCRRYWAPGPRRLARELVGHGELGQADPAEVDLHIGPFGDEQRVVARLGELGEQVPHLPGRLEVVLLALELEPLGVVDGGTGLDAEERVVGDVVLSVGVMAVVGGQQRGPDALGDLDQRGIGLVLRGQPVVLELDEEVVLAEDVLEPGGQVLGSDLIVGQQGLEDHPAQTAGGGDEPVVVTLEQLPVEPGLVVVPLQVGGGRELQQVAVPGCRLGQEGQVVIELLAAVDVASGVVDLAPSDRSIVSRFGGHVGLRADHRIDAGLSTGGIEVEDPVHVPVVGDAECRLTILDGRLHQVLYPSGSVEHRELGVGVQVCERPCGQRWRPSSCRPPAGSPHPVDELQRCDSDHSAVGRVTQTFRIPLHRGGARPGAACRDPAAAYR